MQRWFCKDCQSPFVDEIVASEPAVEPEKVEVKQPDTNGYVVTSYTIGTQVNPIFLGSLETYCKARNMSLVIVPIRRPSSLGIPDEILPYVRGDNIVKKKYKILAACSINPTAASPLMGMEALTQGITTIIGHPQLQMKTVPVTFERDPLILTTTGSISEPDYSETKAGFRGEFNHCQSAILIENDDDIDGFHLRQLLFDGNGFYDGLEYFYPNGIEQVLDAVEALALGDEHFMFLDTDVYDNTFAYPDSIVKTLNPKVLIRHDILDCYTISHHHTQNYLTRIKKHINGQDSIKKELQETCDYLADTSDRTCYVVDSNHNNHLKKWLATTDPKFDIHNSEMYHYLMWLCIKEMRAGRDPNPFKVYFDKNYASHPNYHNVMFLDGEQTVEIKGITISMHGDIGPNGSRGSRQNLSRIGEKAILGHGHAPGVEKGAFQTGTSSILKLEYNKGPSGWLHTHCIIYKNGKRQLLNIIGDKWKR